MRLPAVRPLTARARQLFKDELFHLLEANECPPILQYWLWR